METRPHLVRMAGGRKHPSTRLSLGSGFVRFNQMDVQHLCPFREAPRPKEVSRGVQCSGWLADLGIYPQEKQRSSFWRRRWEETHGKRVGRLSPKRAQHQDLCPLLAFHSLLTLSFLASLSISCLWEGILEMLVLVSHVASHFVLYYKFIHMAIYPAV